MKSPFPGMDPYVEPHWRDIHSRLILYACDQIEESLPSGLIARVEERIVFETEDEEHHRYPDVRMVERAIQGASSGGMAVAVADEVGSTSYLVSIDFEPITERFIEIVDSSGQRVVTVVEFLSLTNKLPGDGLTQYKEKQEELRRGKVSLVEIDLVRSGRRQLVLPVRRIPKKAKTTYLACVRRGWQPGVAEFFPIPLQQRLPKIKIPLREQDQEIALDLQPLLEQAYRKGRYADTIDYSLPPEPLLEGADAKWADELLKAAGKR